MTEYKPKHYMLTLNSDAQYEALAPFGVERFELLPKYASVTVRSARDEKTLCEKLIELGVSYREASTYKTLDDHLKEELE